MEKIVQCPSCGSILNVKNSKGETEKIISCPKCKESLKVKFPPQSKAPSREARDAITVPNFGRNRVEAKTQFAHTQYGIKANKQAVLVYGGKEYRLQEGINTVGRKASNSTAMVQIETTDIYMSRNHVTINCVCRQGTLVKAVISNDRNKNSTYINGTKLHNDDQIVLENGCSIKMGNTIVGYKEITES